MLLLPDMSQLGLALELSWDVPEGGKDYLTVHDRHLFDEASILEQYSLDCMH